MSPTMAGICASAMTRRSAGADMGRFSAAGEAGAMRTLVLWVGIATRVIDEEAIRYYFSLGGITESDLTTTVTVKGEVTLPKAVREAAKIRPGDRVNVRVRPEGGVIIEAEAAVKSAEAYIADSKTSAAVNRSADFQPRRSCG